METIKAINEATFQLMFLVLSVTATTWCGIGIVEAVRFAANEWFESANPPGANPGNEALNGEKQ
jgi:hypothetical protein